MKTILVPTDFSPPAQRALEYAVSLASRTQARIILFHVFSHTVQVELAMEIKEAIKKQQGNEKRRLARLAQEVTMLQTILQGQALGEMVLAEEEAGLGGYTDMVEPAPGKVEIECQARFGLVENEIVKAAKENQADLIVMGMRGGNEFRELLIGSSTSGVMHRTPCPVLAIPETASFQPIQDILFAADFKRLPEQPIVQTFLGLKELFQANLYLMPLYGLAQQDLDQEEVATELQEAFKGHEYFVIPLEKDKVLEDLPRQIQKIDPQLLVVVPRQQNFVSILLSNSLSRMLSFRSPVPLLALPKPRTKA